MTEKDLIIGLKGLKQERPSQEWVVFCRENLVREMDGNIAKESSILTRFSAVFSQVFRVFGPIGSMRPLLRTATVLTAIFIFIFGNGLFAVSKARTSLPGDRLYPVKIALEQAQLLVTPSQEGKTRFQSDIIASRLQELDEVVNAGDSNESKQPKIEEAVSNLQRQLLTVKDELPKLEGLDAKKAVEMAKKIDANALQAQQSLSQAKLALSSEIKQNLSDKIAEVEDEADKTSTRALEVMIKNQAEGNGEIHKEILAKLDEKIQKTVDLKNSIEIAAKSAGQKDFKINATIILDETDKAIEQAKLSLQNDDVQGALRTIKTANELVKSAQKIVETANNIADSDNTTTGGADSSDSNKTISDMPINSDTASSTPSADTATSTPIE